MYINKKISFILYTIIWFIFFNIYIYFLFKINYYIFFKNSCNMDNLKIRIAIALIETLLQLIIHDIFKINQINRIPRV